MATYSKFLLSGSTQGKAIKVAVAVTAGTLIHTAVSGTGDLDEIWLWCVNTSDSAVKLTLEWGEATSPDGHIEVTVSPEAGLAAIIPGLLLQNSLVVRAFAGTVDVLTIHGFVNRITA